MPKIRYNINMAYDNNYKEVVKLPRRDGTGPMGRGSMSGRGLGACTGINAGTGSGLGLGRGRGSKRGFDTSMTQKEILSAQKESFQRRLDIINKQLDNLTE